MEAKQTPLIDLLDRKLWLWKNFEDGRPEYWAFDNPYPTNLEDGDPQTLGQPCGYAIFKQSRDGSCGRTEEQVLREMKNAKSSQRREWVSLTDEEMIDHFQTNVDTGSLLSFVAGARYAEAKLRERNNG